MVLANINRSVLLGYIICLNVVIIIERPRASVTTRLRLLMLLILICRSITLAIIGVKALWLFQLCLVDLVVALPFQIENVFFLSLHLNLILLCLTCQKTIFHQAITCPQIKLINTHDAIHVWWAHHYWRRTHLVLSLNRIVVLE